MPVRLQGMYFVSVIEPEAASEKLTPKLRLLIILKKLKPLLVSIFEDVLHFAIQGNCLILSIAAFVCS